MYEKNNFESKIHQSSFWSISIHKLLNLKISFGIKIIYFKNVYFNKIILTMSKSWIFWNMVCSCVISVLLSLSISFVVSLAPPILLLLTEFYLAWPDWTFHPLIGVEKSGKNVEGDSWWETWQEVLHQDEWRFFYYYNTLAQWLTGDHFFYQVK